MTDKRPLTGAQYLINRIGELEIAVATLIDQKAAVEKERDDLKAAAEAKPSALPEESANG